MDAPRRTRRSQQRVLESLLTSARIVRLVEQEALDGSGAYQPTDFLADVRQGVWAEITGRGSIRIDAYRRNLQRAYLDTVTRRVNGRQAGVDEARALFRAELKALDTEVRGAGER